MRRVLTTAPPCCLHPNTLNHNTTATTLETGGNSWSKYALSCDCPNAQTNPPQCDICGTKAVNEENTFLQHSSKQWILSVSLEKAKVWTVPGCMEILILGCQPFHQISCVRYSLVHYCLPLVWECLRFLCFTWDQLKGAKDVVSSRWN